MEMMDASSEGSSFRGAQAELSLPCETQCEQPREKPRHTQDEQARDTGCEQLRETRCEQPRDTRYADPCRWLRQLKAGRSLLQQCPDCGRREPSLPVNCCGSYSFWGVGTSGRARPVPADVENSSPEHTLWAVGECAKSCQCPGCSVVFMDKAVHSDALNVRNAFNVVMAGGTGRHHCRKCLATFCDNHYKRDCMLIPETYGSQMVSACLTCYQQYCSQAVRLVLVCPDEEVYYALGIVLARMLEDWYPREDPSQPLITLSARQEAGPARLLLCPADGVDLGTELPLGDCTLLKEMLDPVVYAGYTPRSSVVSIVRESQEERRAVPKLTVLWAGEANKALALALSTCVNERYAVELQVPSKPNLFKCASCGRIQILARPDEGCTHCGFVNPQDGAGGSAGLLSKLFTSQAEITEHFSVVTAEGLPVVDGPVSTLQKFDAFLRTVQRLADSSQLLARQLPLPPPKGPVDVGEVRRGGLFMEAIAGIKVLVPCGHVLMDSDTPPGFQDDMVCDVCGERVAHVVTIADCRE